MRISTTVLLWIILILLTLLVIFSIYLTILRLLEKRRLRHEENYVERSKAYWMNYLFYNQEWNEEMVPKTLDEKRAAERLLVKFLNSVYVEGTREKIYLFAERYMTSYYSKMLASTEWSHRMNGLYRVIDFRLVELAEKHLDKWSNRKVRNAEEKYYLSLLKITVGRTTAIDFIKQDEVEFSEHQNRALLLKLEQKDLDALISNYDYLPHDSKLALIDVVGEKNYIHYQEFFVEQLEKEERSEVRIRILKSLELMGFIRDFQPFIPFLSSSFWQERMLASRIVGMFPLSESQHYLLSLLEDESWWVRSTAAKAIAKQKGGISILTNYQLLTADRFAKEIIDEQLLKEETVTL